MGPRGTGSGSAAADAAAAAVGHAVGAGHTAEGTDYRRRCCFLRNGAVGRNLVAAGTHVHHPAAAADPRGCHTTGCMPDSPVGLVGCPRGTRMEGGAALLAEAALLRGLAARCCSMASGPGKESLRHCKVVAAAAAIDIDPAADAHTRSAVAGNAPLLSRAAGRVARALLLLLLLLRIRRYRRRRHNSPG